MPSSWDQLCYIWDTTFLLNPSRAQKQHPKPSHNNLAGGFEYSIVPLTWGNDPIWRIDILLDGLVQLNHHPTFPDASCDVQVALCCFKALNCLKPSQITYSISVEFWSPAKLELLVEDWRNMTCITYIMSIMDIYYIYMICTVYVNIWYVLWSEEGNQKYMVKMIDFVVGNTWMLRPYHEKHLDNFLGAGWC